MWSSFSTSSVQTRPADIEATAKLRCGLSLGFGVVVESDSRGGSKLFHNRGK